MPYMGMCDNVMRQSVSLLEVKDPYSKEWELPDERRMKIGEMGAVQGLLNILETAKDDHTWKEALRALDAISKSDDAVWALKQAGAISVVRSTADSAEDDEVKNYKLSLLDRFGDPIYG